MFFIREKYYHRHLNRRRNLQPNKHLEIQKI